MATAGVRRDVGQAMCRHRLSWPVARKITFAWTLFLPSVFTRTIPRLSCTPAESTSDFGHSSGTSPTYSVDLAIGTRGSAHSHGWGNCAPYAKSNWSAVLSATRTDSRPVAV